MRKRLVNAAVISFFIAFMSILIANISKALTSFGFDSTIASMIESVGSIVGMVFAAIFVVIMFYVEIRGGELL